MKFNKWLLVTGLVLVATGIYFWQWRQNEQPAQPVQVLAVQTTPIPTTSTKLNIYPNPTLTPGDIFGDVTADQVCVPGYTAKVRDVPVALKKQVYAEYGLPYPQVPGTYEADHFIPLELGGSNDIKNLWPEPANPYPGFHQKDAVENYLHKQVCEGMESLQQAQEEIRTDWYAAYGKMR